MEIPRYGILIGLVRRQERPASIADRLSQIPSKDKLIVGAGVVTLGALGFAAWNRMPPEARARVGRVKDTASQRLIVIASAVPDTINKVPQAVSKIKEAIPVGEKDTNGQDADWGS